MKYTENYEKSTIRLRNIALRDTKAFLKKFMVRDNIIQDRLAKKLYEKYDRENRGDVFGRK